MALVSESRSTRSAVIASRDGPNNDIPRPWTPPAATSIQYWTASVEMATAIPNAAAVIADCANIKMERLPIRLASTPDAGIATKLVTPKANTTPPSAVLLPVRS